jgi:transposase
MFITSSKMKFFELFKNKKFKYLFTNWFQSIFEFRKFHGFSRKMSFFSKKAKKSKIQNSVQIKKNLFRKKVLPRSSYIH